MDDGDALWHSWMMRRGRERGDRQEASLSDTLKRNGTGPTDEVGDEGGGTGDVEIERTSVTTGTEGTSSVVTKKVEVDERRRDETGEGRDNP
jgi:hypothetical protein